MRCRGMGIPAFCTSLVGSFFAPFLPGRFFHDFRPSEKTKKGHTRISEEKMTKISGYVFFIWFIFLEKREMFAYFVSNFKFSMFLISKTLFLYEISEL